MNNKKIDKEELKKLEEFYNEFLSNNELKKYIDKYLIDDEDFIKDLESINGFCYDLKDKKTHEDRIDLLNSIIGNGARTYILKIIVTKHLHKSLVRESENFLDLYWLDKAKNFLNENC